MRVYLGHSKNFAFEKELYEPIRNSRLNNKHTIVLPHEKSDKPFNSKEFLKNCDLMIAEVSYPATGLGIELGWADIYGIPIICIYKKNTKPSGSLKVITDKFLEYSNSEELIVKIEEIIKQNFST